MTFGKLVIGDRFQFTDGHLTGNTYRKTKEVTRIAKPQFRLNAFCEGNPSTFIRVEDTEPVNQVSESCQ